MFDLYHVQDTAAHRQSELLNDLAADRLARSLTEGNEPSGTRHPSPARRLIILVTDTLAAIGGTVSTAGRRPRWS